ncbi:MAG: LptE family protein [Candidatus Omnitrophica bacterium]|nr:LptE family protein [Candidatus Omnitrophota bacterium]
MMKSIVRLFIGIFLLINLFSCGYTTHSLIDPNIKNIYIEPFKNRIDFTNEYSEYGRLRTYYPLLETDITDAIVDRFIFDGNLKIVKEKEADVILKGELIDYRKDSLRYTDSDDIEEYRINIIVNIKLWSKHKEDYLWQEDNFIGDTTYFTTGSLAKSESAAVKDALTDLARRVVERTIENW